MIVWKVTLQDFITRADLAPILIETQHDELQELERLLYQYNHLTEKTRLRLVEKVGYITRQSCGCGQRLHQSTGQGY